MFQLTVGGKTTLFPEAKKDEAMRRYFEAQGSGDSTARLVAVKNPPEGTLSVSAVSDDDDPNDPPPAPPTPAGQVSVLAEERIQLQGRWLAEAGFSLAPPLFAPGTRVMKLGDDNFRTARTRVDAMPRFTEAADRVIGHVQAEARRDIPVALRRITMTDDGRLSLDSGEAYGLEADAFTQLCVLAGFGSGARYLRESCKPDLRAYNVNRQIADQRNRKLVLRTRQIDTDPRQVFAVVTPTYAAVDTDEVLDRVKYALSDAHTEMRYAGSGVTATALWMPDAVVDLAAGDVFKVGVRVETDDTGRGRIRISGVAWRNRCLNLLIIDEGTVETVSAVHRGSTTRILASLNEGVDAARQTVSRFLDAWGHARTVRVDVPETLKSWVETKRLKVPTREDNEAIVEALLASWQKEPGDTLADAVNAVTRAAHEVGYWDNVIRESIERQAAKLVYVTR